MLQIIVTLILLPSMACFSYPVTDQSTQDGETNTAARSPHATYPYLRFPISDHGMVLPKQPEAAPPLELGRSLPYDYQDPNNMLTNTAPSGENYGYNQQHVPVTYGGISGAFPYTALTAGGAAGGSLGYVQEYGFDHGDETIIPIGNFPLTRYRRIYGYRHGPFYGIGLFVDIPPFYGIGAVKDGIGGDPIVDLIALLAMSEGKMRSAAGPRRLI